MGLGSVIKAIFSILMPRLQFWFFWFKCFLRPLIWPLCIFFFFTTFLKTFWNCFYYYKYFFCKQKIFLRTPYIQKVRDTTFSRPKFVPFFILSSSTPTPCASFLSQMILSISCRQVPKRRMKTVLTCKCTLKTVSNA